MTKDIEFVMNPRSIAVVGATNRPGSVGLAVFRNILNAGFQGVLYPVNPKAKSVQSVKAYPKLADIPDEVDLAVIVVPAKVVIKVMNEVAKKGVKAVVIITSGFSEVGNYKLENEVTAIAKKAKKRKIEVDRQSYVYAGKKIYCLDFEINCRKGKIDVETYKPDLFLKPAS